MTLNKSVKNKSNQRLYFIDILGEQGLLEPEARYFGGTQDEISLTYSVVPNDITEYSKYFVGDNIKNNMMMLMSLKKPAFDIELWSKRIPEKSNPLFIPEVGIVVARTQEEINEMLMKFKTPKKIWSYYMGEHIESLDGIVSQTILISLDDTQYYSISRKNVVYALPRVNSIKKMKYIDSYLTDADKEKLDTHDAVITKVMVMRDGVSKTGSSDYGASSPIFIKKNDNSKIFYTDVGQVVFKQKEHAEEFIELYGGSIQNHLMDIAQKKVKKEYERKIREVKQEVIESRKTATTYVGKFVTSGVISIAVEKLISKFLLKN